MAYWLSKIATDRDTFVAHANYPGWVNRMLGKPARGGALHGQEQFVAVSEPLPRWAGQARTYTQDISDCYFSVRF